MTRRGAAQCLLLAVAGVGAGAWAVRDLRDARRRGVEAGVQGALRTLMTAQAVFLEDDRDGDGVRDYGALEELAKAGLIPAQLGGGSGYGYRFVLVTRPPDAAGPARWLCVATPGAGPPPPEVDVPGTRSLCATQDGEVYHTERSTLELTADCSVPPGMTRYGK